jgi:predicted AlkP superfamily phosphohydrolase/phosphomutase
VGDGATRVLIIGLDAATFDLIEPWAAAGDLPHLARLMREGTCGRLASTLQPATAPAWVSFMTGMNQGQHGLYDFVRRRAGSYSLEVTNGSHVAAPLMFETLSRLGRRVITVNIPYTYPPRPVNGIMVGGPFAPAFTREVVYPPEYFEVLKAIAPDYFVIADYDAHAADPLGAFAAKLQREVELREQVSVALMQREAWDVFAVVVMATDEVQHSFWHCLEAAEGDPLVKYRDVIRGIYRRCDELVGKLLATLPQDGRATDVIILSDHGAGRFEWMVNLNEWLAQQNLLHFQTAQISPMRRWRSRVLGTAAKVYQRYVPPRWQWAVRRRLGAQRFGKVQEEFQSALVTSAIDWAQTQVYALGTGGNICVNLQGREPNGIVSPEDYEAVRQRIIDGLMTLRDPKNGQPMVARAYRREELYHGAKLDLAPDIIIQWATYAYWGRGYDYWGRGSSRQQKPVLEEPRFSDESDQPLTGAHRPDGILIAYGPHIRSGVEITNARLIDLAPTVFQLLGFVPPIEMDGRVLTDMLLTAEAGHVQAVNEPGAAGSVEYTPEEAELISQHLRALGYL